MHAELCYFLMIGNIKKKPLQICYIKSPKYSNIPNSRSLAMQFEAIICYEMFQTNI